MSSYISSKLVSTPFSRETIVVVSADRWMPVCQLAAALGVEKRTLQHKLERGTEFEQFSKEEIVKKFGKTVPRVTNFISKKGLIKFLRGYMSWSDDEVQQALSQLFDESEKDTPTPAKTKVIARKSVGKSTGFSDDEEDDGDVDGEYEGELSSSAHSSISSSAPPRKTIEKKRERQPPAEVSDILETLQVQQDAFLERVDQRIGEQAIWRYQRTPDFTQKLDTLLQEEADKVLPALRKELEEKLRSELEPRLRKQLKLDITAKLQPELKAFRDKLFEDQTQKVFNTSPAKDSQFSQSELISSVLQKKFGQQSAKK